MKTEFAGPRYEVRLPVAVWTSDLTEGRGVTAYMSGNDVCFSLDSPSTIEPGTAVMLFVTMPLEVTGGNRVQLRASGRIVNAERGVASKGNSRNMVVSMDWYDFVRPETSPQHRLFELQRGYASNSLASRS